MLKRRQFLAASSAAALRPQRILGANDRIGVGLIGCGVRGVGSLLKDALLFREESNIDIRAVCDIWRQQRENAAAKVKEAGAGDPRQMTAYRELLASKDIDAVIIATPDHQHCTMLIDAVRAGKDAYVEKPLAMDMKELNEAFDAVKKSGRIVQMGTQVRSLPSAMAARKFIREGKLGRVLKIEQSRNSVHPYWHRYGERKLEETDTNWRAFLMQRKPRAWDADQYAGWFGYRDFSRGPHSNLMVHFIDLVHHFTGVEPPRRVVTLGGSYRWKENYTAPDSVETVLDYGEDNFLVRYNTTFGTGAGNYLKVFGTKGTLDASNWSGKPFTVTGLGAEEPLAEGTLIDEMESDAHMLNWLKCLRTRQQPNAPIEAGFSHSVAVILSDESLMRGRRMVYDGQRRAIREG
ncbi:MAG: Gfo/Idh/MocA family oxidoreductase [Acidobacteriia bacterium]|nr:Gfo/Idh/MocA family oxidoreductase [Terriglobia bacterium]